jgi:hypothetical protein
MDWKVMFWIILAMLNAINVAMFYSLNYHAFAYAYAFIALLCAIVGVISLLKERTPNDA